MCSNRPEELGCLTISGPRSGAWVWRQCCCHCWTNERQPGPAGSCHWPGWRHLAGSGNLDQWQVACRHVVCRDSVSWRCVRPSSQVDFRRMNGETCDWPFGGGPARPYKGKHAGSSAHLKVGLHSGNMSLWTSEENEKKERKEEEEEEEQRRRRLRSSEAD